MGVSGVLLCPYRYLKDIMVNSKNSKFNSNGILVLVPKYMASDATSKAAHMAASEVA